MNAKQTRWSRRYQTVLREYLKQGPGPGSSLEPASELGCQAAALGLETLDVARVHEGALAALESSDGRGGVIKRTDAFFAEAVVPIERTHRAAVAANRHVKRLTATLDRCTSGLVTSKRYLERRIAQRKNAEESLKKSREHYIKLLEESHHLQKHLRQLTHRIMSAHEHEKERVSHELHDEIAQTLLGINVRLLTLRTGAEFNARGLKKDIASTQRLVGEFVKRMTRYTHELGSHHEK